MSRGAALRRWKMLTEQILPGMAEAQNWPIRLDHCFKRLCLDNAVGARWDTLVGRPAIRCISDAQLQAAVAVADRIRADPAILPELNRFSLRLRGHG